MKINLIKLSIISLLFSVVFSLNIAYAVPTNTVQTGNTTNATNTTAITISSTISFPPWITNINDNNPTDLPIKFARKYQPKFILTLPAI